MQSFSPTTGTTCTSTILRKTRDRTLRMLHRCFRIRGTEGDCAEVVVRKGVIRFEFDDRREHLSGFRVATQTKQQRSPGYGERRGLRSREQRSAQGVLRFRDPVGAGQQLGNGGEATRVGRVILQQSDRVSQAAPFGETTRSGDRVFLRSRDEWKRAERRRSAR